MTRTDSTGLREDDAENEAAKEAEKLKDEERKQSTRKAVDKFVALYNSLDLSESERKKATDGLYSAIDKKGIDSKEVKDRLFSMAQQAYKGKCRDFMFLDVSLSSVKRSMDRVTLGYRIADMSPFDGKFESLIVQEALFPSMDIAATAAMNAGAIPGAEILARKAVKNFTAGTLNIKSLAKSVNKIADTADLPGGVPANALDGPDAPGSGEKPGNYRPAGELPKTNAGVPKPSSEYPHTQLGTQTSRKAGDYTQAREWGYGTNGNLEPKRLIDFTDHGRPAQHPNRQFKSEVHG